MLVKQIMISVPPRITPCNIQVFQGPRWFIFQDLKLERINSWGFTRHVSEHTMSQALGPANIWPALSSRQTLTNDKICNSPGNDQRQHGARCNVGGKISGHWESDAMLIWGGENSKDVDDDDGALARQWRHVLTRACKQLYYNAARDQTTTDGPVDRRPYRLTAVQTRHEWRTTAYKR